MEIKNLICKISRLAPRVKLGLLEWDIPDFIRNALDCEANKKAIVCYRDIHGKEVCVVIPRVEANETSQTLKEQF